MRLRAVHPCRGTSPWCPLPNSNRLIATPAPIPASKFGSWLTLIKRFGAINPVVIDDQGRLVAGHARLEAAKQLGLTHLPAIRVSHLSDAELRAYALADNKLAEMAGWDRAELAIEIEQLVEGIA